MSNMGAEAHLDKQPAGLKSALFYLPFFDAAPLL
jgi:hypothetical protein